METRMLQRLSIVSGVTQVKRKDSTLSFTCFYHNTFAHYQRELNDSYVTMEKIASLQTGISSSSNRV